MEKTDALILAGGTLSEDLKKYSSGHDNRAMLKIGDKRMIEYVVDALRGTPEIGEIVVVGLKQPLEEVLGGRVDAVLESKPGMLDNLKMGVERFKNKKRMLVATCDIPLVKPEMIEGFLRACKKEQADLYYPIVEKKLNDQKFPETKRTYFRLKEGVFTGGNVFLLNPAALLENWGYIDRILAARKKPWKIVGMLGFGFIVGFLLHRLSIPVIEQKVERITGCKGKPVMTQYPEIGVDVDKESDYLLVKKVLE
ncbi:MAG TPA: nucleotidyltransferase family protein [bacterium]|nr:nucleotidyltransferase family protein [bacterium]